MSIVNDDSNVVNNFGILNNCLVTESFFGTNRAVMSRMFSDMGLDYYIKNIISKTPETQEQPSDHISVLTIQHSACYQSESFLRLHSRINH